MVHTCALVMKLVLCLVVFSSVIVNNANGRTLPAFLFTRNNMYGPCTPQYWGSRMEEWPKNVPQRSTVTNIFGSTTIERFRSDLTLLEATTRNDDVENEYVRLLKQSSAALLNSYARMGFPYKAWEVKSMLLLGLLSLDSAAQQAQLLKLANDACQLY